MSTVGPVDHHRLAALYVTPSEATDYEIKHIAEELYKARRNAGTKSLRDEFAATAITGHFPSSKSDAMAWAKRAYQMADAMLEARKL